MRHKERLKDVSLDCFFGRLDVFSGVVPGKDSDDDYTALFDLQINRESHLVSRMRMSLLQDFLPEIMMTMRSLSLKSLEEMLLFEEKKEKLK